MEFQVLLTWISSNFTDIGICYDWETTGHLKVIAFKAKYWMTYCYTFSVALSPELNISYQHTSMGFLLCRQYHLSMGVSAGAAAGQKHLPQVHQVDAERERDFQAGWLQSCIQIVGETQEQAWYELWDYGQSPQVSFHKTLQKSHL